MKTNTFNIASFKDKFSKETSTQSKTRNNLSSYPSKIKSLQEINAHFRKEIHGLRLKAGILKIELDKNN